MKKIITLLLLLSLSFTAKSQLITYFGKYTLPISSASVERAQELAEKLLEEEGENALSQVHIKAKPEDVIRYREIMIQVGYIDQINKKPVLDYLIEKNLDEEKIYEFLETREPVCLVSYKARMVIITTNDYEFTQIFIKDDRKPYLLLVNGTYLRKSNYVKYPYIIHYTGVGVGVNTEHTENTFKLR